MLAVVGGGEDSDAAWVLFFTLPQVELVPILLLFMSTNQGSQAFLLKESLKAWPAEFDRCLATIVVLLGRIYCLIVILNRIGPDKVIH